MVTHNLGLPHADFYFSLQYQCLVKTLKPLFQKSRADLSFCYRRAVTGRSFSTHLEQSSKAQKSDEKVEELPLAFFEHSSDLCLR